MLPIQRPSLHGAHSPGFRLDATIVVVDAETIRTKSRDKYVGDTIVAQLASGDIVILNKTDLVDAGHLAATEEWLCNTCPDAVVIQAQDAAVDPHVAFGRHRSAWHADAGPYPCPMRSSPLGTGAHDGGPVDRPLIEVMMADLR